MEGGLINGTLQYVSVSRVFQHGFEPLVKLLFYMTAMHWIMHCKNEVCIAYQWCDLDTGGVKTTLYIVWLSHSGI